MTYATQAQLTDLYGAQRLIELTDRAEPAAGAIDTEVLSQALVDADALIDSYVAARYVVPVDPAPAVLTRKAAEIAYYNLHIEAAPDAVRDSYRDAIKWLQAIASGNAVLPAASGQAAGPAAASDTVNVSGPDRVFSRTDLAGF